MDTQAAAIQYVGVDHGRAYVTMAEQFLDGPYVVPALDEVRGKRVAKGMARRPLGNAGLPHRSADGSLNPGRMPADQAVDLAHLVSANGAARLVAAARLARRRMHAAADSATSDTSPAKACRPMTAFEKPNMQS